MTLERSEEVIKEYIKFGDLDNPDFDETELLPAIKSMYKSWYEYKHRGKFYKCPYCGKESFSKKYISHCDDKDCIEKYKRDCYNKNVYRSKDKSDWYCLYRKLYLRFQGRVRKDRPHTNYDVELFNTYKKEANEWKKAINRNYKTPEEFMNWLKDFEHKGEIALIARISSPEDPEICAKEIYEKLKK